MDGKRPIVWKRLTWSSGTKTKIRVARLILVSIILLFAVSTLLVQYRHSSPIRSRHWVHTKPKPKVVVAAPQPPAEEVTGEVERTRREAQLVPDFTQRRRAQNQEIFSVVAQHFQTVQLLKSGRGPDLNVAIPSLPRTEADTGRANLLVLKRTLDSFVSRGSLKNQSVRILLVNNEPAPGIHSAFEQLKALQSAEYPDVDFLHNHHVMRLRNAKRRFPSIDNAVYQHSLDVVATIMLIYPRLSVNSMYIFHEDDFPACEGWLDGVRNLIAGADKLFAECWSLNPIMKASKWQSPRILRAAFGTAGWRGLRASHAMAGIVVPAAALPSIVRYILHRIEEAPPDHILVEWLLGAGSSPWESTQCPFFICRKNHFTHHGGNVSTFAGRRYDDSQLPQCGDALTRRGLFRDGERFDDEQCPSDEIYPCPEEIGRRVAAARARS